jgi:pyruvate dehydrogenase E2 component (dihydrolipoamide acetyltransferase)
MEQAFKLPDLGEGIHEGEVVAVLVGVGDAVLEGQPILEVETDKARVEIPSPFTGRVRDIRVAPGEIVQVGTVLMLFEVVDKAVASGAAEAPPPSPAPVPTAPVGPAAARAPSTPVAAPVPASPATRRLARDLGVDLHLVTGSGPQGLVTADDVRRFAAHSARGGETPSAAAPVPAAPRGGALPDFSRWGPVDIVPLRSVRRTTARRLAVSWAQIPHVSHQDVADISQLEALRRKHRAAVEAVGGRLTPTVFVIKAVVAALKHHPQVNASLDMEREEVILKRYYHVGVAVDTERGLMVPVLRDVDRKSIAEIAVELHQLAERTRAGTGTLEDLQGGTITVTNIGALGGTGLAPLINHPQVAILGTGRARLQPVVHGDLEHYEIVPRLLMPLVLTFDHRVLDGADGARFLLRVIGLLENPEQLLLAL